MPRPNKYDKQHLRNLGLTEKQIEKIYDTAIKEAAAIGVSIHDFDPDKPFSFSDYPQTKARIEKLLKSLQKNTETVIVNGVRSGWALANNKNNALCDRVFGDNKYKLTKEQERRYYSNNDKARKAFLERKAAGLNLSDRVWNYTDQFKSEIEMGIDLGLRDGLPAAEIARDLKQYLKAPDKLFRRVRDEHGQLHLSKAAKAYHPGAGVYRSSFKNARRLAVTETNMAYRTSDHTRWQQLDFVVGIEVRLSNNHTLNGKPFTDICDDLKGKYPKTFKFTGWHPLCYDELSEVYTDRGWQFFKDVKIHDKIMSINTITYDLEWAGIVLQQTYPYTGDMAHFFNRSLDILVTPEHEMLVLSKQDAKTFRRIEARKCGKTQPIYRSCNWNGVHCENININGLEINFNLFCRFMGYWLSDGSLGHKYSISIAQQDENKLQIYDCIAAMNLKPRYNSGKVEVNSRELYDYLKQFGRCYSKYIPDVIKEAVPYQIKIFLDAFVSCDGRVKSPKSFIGNKGNLCSPSECQRIYYTSSVRMADDIGELILKIGMRPSFRVQRSKGRLQTFKNGIYTINRDGIIISECSSKTATQYSKEFVPYSGTVYDLTLDRNNTMYIRRNGKCFWGSNCRCYAVSVLKSEEEMAADNARRMNGEELSSESVNSVKDVPEGFTKWVEKNAGRIAKANDKGTLPYFLKDNRAAWKDLTSIQYINVQKINEARHFSAEFDNASKTIAKDIGVTVTDVNLKSDKRIFEKAIVDYHGDIAKVNDIIRNTYICQENKIESVISKIESSFKVNEDKHQNFLSGYTGRLLKVQYKDGILAEIQVNTPQMIYGKEVNAKQLLGAKLFNDIKEKSGLPSGLGHKFYEKLRQMSKKELASPKGQALLKQSREYYETIRKVKVEF